MIRQPSHSSSLSSSTPAASPKGRLSFFKKSKFGSRDESGSSDKVYEAPPSDKILASPLFMPETEMTRSNGSLPSPDPFIAATHDTEYLHLRENIRRLRKAPPGPDPKKVDAVWEVYKKLREESLHLCKNLLHKSQDTGRNASLESSTLGPLESRSSNSGSLTETTLPFQVNETWFSSINEYKVLLEGMLENLRISLLATYRSYEPDATERQLEAFLADKIHRKNLIMKWRDTSVHRMKSEKLLFWEQYKIRSLNYDKLRLDLQAIETLFEVADSGEAPNMAIREYVIARNGDTVLEFANAASEVNPILRFRVSSHLLAEASSLFAQILSPSLQGSDIPLDMIADLPPPPKKDICKDGMEVKVYRMPQIELNENESLTILLHAAHMHITKVPREIDFAVFVSIAEVCTRYRCISPIELQVEYQWLPQWADVVGDEYRDGLLLIGYAFGGQDRKAIFKRMSKIAILGSVDDSEIENKRQWPQAVKEKIKAVRSAKLDQIYACCINAIEEYLRPPLDSTNRRSSVGSLTLTSVPRCPRGSHQCDATNLGWLMLVYNELRLLPSVMNNASFHDLPKSPRRSLRELVDCLRLMSSAPQVHSGVCDYAPTFRSAINDIYNSVTGLTLRDISGRGGWGSSRDSVPADDIPPEVHELSAIEFGEERNNLPPMSSNEAVCLKILSHIDDIEDLNAAAMIDKGFYGVYKRNEAALLKNIMRAERRRTLSGASLDIRRISGDLQMKVAPSRPTNISTTEGRGDSKYLVADITRSEREDLYGASPPCSPINQDETPMSTEEAHKILWPDNMLPKPQPNLSNGQPVERNEKYIMGDVAYIEDKTIMEEDKKHLRDEKDMALGLGAHKPKGKP